MSIRAINIVKRFARFAALDSVSLEVAPGRLTALLGPSGSGKTTLLRIIAGLERPDSGEVFFEEEVVTRRPAKDRGAGFVFQHYALFNHMTVFENIAFGLRVRGRKDDEVRHRVHALLDLIRLSGLERRFPSQLSGGQRQRVALARALASKPKVLLLDEPFGALDAKVRRELRDWIRRLHEEIHMTSLFVTHDQEEAFEVADRVVILNHGRIEQEGSPQDIFDEPANAFVMEFLGDVNVFDGEVSRNKVKAGPFTVPVGWYDGYSPLPAKLFVRPHEWDLSGAEADGGITAEVLHASPMGSRMKLGLKARPGGALINAEVDRAHYDRMAIAERSLVMVVPRKPRVFVQYGSL